MDADVWAPLRHMLGAWRGPSEGKPGKGELEREYRLVLNGRYVEVRNRSVYVPQDGNPGGETHEDVGFISYDRGRERFVLRQFHVEGFVNTYVMEPPTAADERVFTTEAIENIPPGWRARETYRFTAPDELVETFELAEPGGDFALYSRCHLRRA